MKQNSRTQIAEDNDTSRATIHRDDTHQIKDLSEKLEKHCEQNEARDVLIDERDSNTEKKIDQLLPLVDLIPTLKGIVEDKKATVFMGRKLLRIVGYVSAALGLLYLIFKFWADIKNIK